MPKKKKYCFILGKRWYQASQYKTELWGYSAVVLFATAACCWKITLFCLVHFKEMFHQFCTVDSGSQNKKWPESKLECSRRDNEASSQEFLWVPYFEPQPIHCNEALQCQTNTRSKKLWTAQKAILSEQFIFWILTRQRTDWTQRTTFCWIFQPLTRKTANVGALLRFFHHLLWPELIWRAGNWYRTAVICSWREGTRRVIWPETKAEWTFDRKRFFTDSFSAISVRDLFPWTCCVKHKNMTNESLGFSKKISETQRYQVSVARLTAVMTLPWSSVNSVAKV